MPEALQEGVQVMGGPINLLSADRIVAVSLTGSLEGQASAQALHWGPERHGGPPAFLPGPTRRPLLSQPPPPLVLLHQVLKRFTGGGTVVVDHNTIFATLIVQVSSLWEGGNGLGAES